MASDFAPVLKVSLAAMVGNVAGLVSRNRCGAALASRHWVVIVQVTGLYAAVAEVTGHTLRFSFRIEIWLKEPLSKVEDSQKEKRREDLPLAATCCSLGR